MKRVSCWLMAVVFGLGVFGALASPARAAKGEKKGRTEKGDRIVTLEEIPAPARRTILKEAGGNKVHKEIEEEIEDGRTFYEAKWEADGREVEVKVTPEGKLVEGEMKVSLIVALEEIPAPARRTILKEAGGNKVHKEIEEEIEDGRTFYEAKWEADGREVEVKVTPEGKLVEREMKVSLGQVPSWVKATILKQAGDHKVEKVEEVVAGDHKFYEAKCKVGDKKIEIKVAPDGKLLGREVEGEDGDNGNGDDGDEDEDEDEDEEQVTIDQVPAAVKATILAEAGNNKIEEIEKENENGKTIYEAEWHEGDKEIEIKVAPDGTLLEREVEDEEDDDDDADHQDGDDDDDDEDDHDDGDDDDDDDDDDD